MPDRRRDDRHEPRRFPASGHLVFSRSLASVFCFPNRFRDTAVPIHRSDAGKGPRIGWLARLLQTGFAVRPETLNATRGEGEALIHSIAVQWEQRKQLGRLIE